VGQVRDGSLGAVLAVILRFNSSKFGQCASLLPLSAPKALLLRWLPCRNVSGTRVIVPIRPQLAGASTPPTESLPATMVVGGVSFLSYGAHCDCYPHAYLTAAAAIGGSREEASEFCTRLKRVVAEALAKQRRAGEGQAGVAAAAALPDIQNDQATSS
jgi:hypothetical protein